jgi:hypothetical protein
VAWEKTSDMAALVNPHFANSNKKWTREDDDLLRSLVDANTAVGRVAIELKRTVSAVRNRALYLKVHLRRDLKLRGTGAV